MILSISTAEPSSCQRTVTLYGEKTETQRNVFRMLLKFRSTLARFLAGRWSFFGLGSEKKWHGIYSDKSDGNWDRTAEMIMVQLNAESGHPIFSASSVLERVDLRSKGHGKKSTAQRIEQKLSRRFS